MAPQILRGPLPITPAPLPPDFVYSSDWMRVPRTVEYSGLPQSTLYELIAAGELVTFTMQLKKGRKRGVRYISRQSVDSFFNRKAREAGAPAPDSLLAQRALNREAVAK